MSNEHRDWVMDCESNYPPEVRICKHCKLPTESSATDYSVFEEMDWVCFHMIFEHSTRAGVPCKDMPECPVHEFPDVEYSQEYIRARLKFFPNNYKNH